MKVLERKTVRFTQVIQECGQPELTVLWTKPRDDPDFWKAVQQKRIVTLMQTNVGTKKDFGLVGFFEKSQVAYLVFPKALPYPQETKVIGIKYEQIHERAPRGPLYIKPAEKPIPARQPEKKAPEPIRPTPGPEPPKAAKEPPKQRFRSELSLVLTQTIGIEVEAATASEAARLIKQKAETLKLDPGAAKESRKLSKPRRLK